LNLNDDNKATGTLVFLFRFDFDTSYNERVAGDRSAKAMEFGAAGRGGRRES
jgi:hypothetical protein